MNAFLDKYSVAMTNLILKDKWFESSLESYSLIELTKKIDVGPIASLHPSITESMLHLMVYHLIQHLKL